MIASIEYVIIFIMNMIALGVFGVVGYFFLRREVNNTVMDLVDGFQQIFVDPSVKRAYTIMGKESGRVRAEKATVDAIATQVLSGPQLSGLKMAGKAIGVDIDALIEEHGAVETLSGLRQLGSMLGIDINQLLTQGAIGLNTTTESSSTTGMHLKG